jgi:hypothetical protein
MNFNDLLTQIETVESHDRPDVTLNLSDLRVNDDLNIAVPNEGSYSMTPWSRRQIANMLGFKFDRWFENASNDEKAYELNRRLNRATGQIKLRLSGLSDNDIISDGTIKAFVSPTYTAVSDSLLGSMILHSTQNSNSMIPVIRANLTDKTVSYAIRISDPFRTQTNDSVGDIWGGIFIQNSGVGFSSLSINLHLMRLVCTNGMTAPVAGATLFRRRHIGNPEEDLWSNITQILQDVPEKLSLAVQNLRQAQNIKVFDAKQAIEAIIKQAHMPKKLVDPFILAYEKEPFPTAFGIAQAVTDFQTHEQLGLIPEDRKQLEDAAAKYIAIAA